ncbi:MAG: hypothetical protein M3362_16700 [Acidobacteriota bacterium]|nr:hypothetical protein [Acidobacteriota bacterium]
MERITISIASRLLMSAAVLITLVVGPLLGVSFVNAALRTTDADSRSESKAGVTPSRTSQASPSFTGLLETADCNKISGWAADASQPNTSINVSVFADSTLITTAPANLSRPDLAGDLGKGLHGFNIPFPPALKDGHPHAIGVRFESTSVELSGSPKTVTGCVTPPEGAGEQVRLDLTFKINNGQETTKGRLFSLNFDAREVTARGIRHEATVTEYRVREVGLNEPLTSISASPWQPFTHPLILAAGERNDFGELYGERRVLLQVKTATLTSDVVSDTIVLEPVLKEYTVHANSDHTNPLIQYAASQGFTFQRSFFQPCSGGKGGGAPSDISSGSAFITGGALACPPASGPAAAEIAAEDPKCETKFEYELFFGRELNKFWHIKSVSVTGADVKFHGVNRYLLKGHVIEQPDCCPPGTHAVDSACTPFSDNRLPTVTIGDIVIEGPEADDFVDTNNPWKNAFVKPPLTIRPNTRRPN